MSNTNPGPSNQTAVNYYEITTGNFGRAYLQLGGAYATSVDSSGNITGWMEGGVQYTLVYSSGVLQSISASGVTNTISYPNGLLQVAVS
jgi:hypothetical protein